MGRSQETYNKKEVKNQKEKKRKEKERKKLERKSSEKSGSFDDMIAYVDEFGNISSTPPDPGKKTSVNSEDIEISVPKRIAEERDPLRKGIVTFFNDAKGFGFIRDLETQESVYVHADNLMEPIKENNLVNFEAGMGPKGPIATQVRLLKN